MKIGTPLLCVSIAGSCLVIASAVSAPRAAAGPLDPPAGPVAATYRTLAEVEPRIPINAINTPGDGDSVYQITGSGHYYLTGEVFGQVSKRTIKIFANNVTIDLNGFAMRGPGTSAIAGIGVVNSNAVGIVIRNGSISNHAIGVDVGSTRGARVENIKSLDCRTGVVVGDRGWIRDCVFWNQSTAGISAGNSCVIERCRVFPSGNGGFSAGENARFIECTASVSGVGFSAGPWARFRDCFASECGTGFAVGEGAAFERCDATRNRGTGFDCGTSGTLADCTANSNGTTTPGHGFRVGSRSTLTNCSAALNTLDGISGGDSVSVRTCSVMENSGRGITIYNGGHVVDNLTRNNQLDGIFVNFSCIVSANTCNGDGAADGVHGAIRVIGQANRIEGNNITFADRGLLVEAGGNTAIRNSVKGCAANFAIVVGNDVGPIGSASASSSPWANIEY